MGNLQVLSRRVNYVTRRPTAYQDFTPGKID